jgi:hypothetical protein
MLLLDNLHDSYYIVYILRKGGFPIILKMVIIPGIILGAAAFVLALSYSKLFNRHISKILNRLAIYTIALVIAITICILWEAYSPS